MNENGKIDNSLEMPPGRVEILEDPFKPPADYRKYVRPIIAISITLLVMYLGVTGKINADTIIALFGTIAGFYFGERAGKKAG